MKCFHQTFLYLVHVIKYGMCRFIFHDFLFPFINEKKKLKNYVGYLAHIIANVNKRRRNEWREKKFPTLVFSPGNNIYDDNNDDDERRGKKIEKYFCDWYECQFYAWDNFETYHSLFTQPSSSQVFRHLSLKEAFKIHEDDVKNKKKFLCFRKRGKRHKK